jgi:hypothetical protein
MSNTVAATGAMRDMPYAVMGTFNEVFDPWIAVRASTKRNRDPGRLSRHAAPRAPRRIVVTTPVVGT